MADSPANADFLVEIGTEELPPRALPDLQAGFASGLETALRKARLNFNELQSFATPRRLAVLVTGLQLQQTPKQVERRGPPIRQSFDDDGNPTRAAEAFAKSCGVTPAKLETLETDKGTWLVYRGEVAGQAAADVLPDMVAATLKNLPIPKRMRWGDRTVEFVRPAHWVLMLLGKQVLDATILGLTAGRTTLGHRFHAPGEIELKQPADYAKQLSSKGMVIADFDERATRIRAAAEAAVADLDGTPVLEDSVVNEVAALVEWPVAVRGSFDPKFLRLPVEVLTATLQDQQRYFPVRDAAGELLPEFIAISNIDSKEPEQVRKGNERVVRPRLADASFFWDQDSKNTLAERREQLKNVVFQRGLGSLYEKSERVAALAAHIGTKLGADPDTVSRAAALAKTDLLTQLVGEFPSLQGRMGYYYALNDGEAPEVAVALEEQYLPRHGGGQLPETPVGWALGLADRLDTLAGVFALGRRPTGNKDPFALRRTALGLVRILIEKEIDLDLPTMLGEAVDLQPLNKIDRDELVDALFAFIVERMRAYYLDGIAPGLEPGDVSVEMFESVRARAPGSPLDFHQRLEAVRSFLELDESESLAIANKRIANILRSADAAADGVDPSLFQADEERALSDAVDAVLPRHQADLEERNYTSVLHNLAALREPVDAFFDSVMVLAEDEAQRNNRLAQLTRLRELFLDVADLSCIPS